MIRKPTYEELQRRVKELEKESVERKQAEEKLEKHLESLLHYSSLAIVTLDDKHRIISCNRYFENLFQFEEPEIIGKNLDQVIARKEYMKDAISYTKKTLRGEVIHGSGKRYRKDGIFVDVEFIRVPVVIEGKVAGAYGIYLDVTERKQSEAALRESEEQYRSLFETVPASVILIDKDGQMIDINPYHLTHIAKGKFPKKEFIGKNIVTHQTIVNAGLSEMYKKVLEGEPFDQKDVYFPALMAGDDGYFNVKGMPLLKNGEVIGAVIMHEDITERKQAEESLRESERKLSIRNKIAEIFLTTPEDEMYGEVLSVILESMESEYGVFGYIDEDGALVCPSMTRGVWDQCQIPDKDIVFPREKWGGIWGKALIEKKSLYSNEPFSVPQGHIPILRALDVPIIYQGAVIGNLLVGNKPTDYDEKGKQSLEIIADHIAPILHARLQRDQQEAIRKQAEESLKESEEKYRLFVESANEGIVLTQEGKIAYINPRALEVMGYSEVEMISRNLMEFIHPDDRERILELYFKKLKGEDVPPSIYRIIDKDGSTRWVESRSTALTYEGKPALLTFLIDVTERKQVDEALLESKEFLQSVFDAIQDGVSVLDTDLNILRVNSWMESMYTDEAPLVGKKCYMAYQKRDTPCPWCPTLKTIETGETHSSLVPYPSEKNPIGWIDLSAFPLKDVDGQVTGIIEYVNDITEQKKAEEALEKSKERYRSLFDRLPVGAFRSTPNGRFLDANPAFMTLLGCPDLETLLNTPVTTFYRDPKERERWKKLAEKEGESFAMEVQWQKLDGTPLWVRESARVVRDSQGRVQYYEGVAEDITEIKRAEEEQKDIESQLQHAQRMEALGTLAGGIAHDFNNLLMGIQGNASLILLEKDTTHPDYERLKNIEQYVQGGADLTKQLLGFAKGGKYDTKPTDLNEVIEKSSRMFGRTKKEITIHTKYQKAIWPAVVDKGQIEQTLINLYVNAWQAMPAGGHLYLETRNEILDKDYVKSFNIKPGRYIKISIADTGVGMDEATQQRIFEPFFTTKEMGRGTGLGLASAYGIIKNHGGHINVYSEKSEGTIFTIYLPASGTEIIKEEEVSDTIKMGTETILIVDDEDMILNVGNHMLKKLGYTVLIARSGKEAVDIYKINKEKIDIVILDMIMPVMGGGETYDRIKEINPNVKVLLSSGYSMDGQAAEILKKGCDGFIQKPFTAREVAQRIREILDKE